MNRGTEDAVIEKETEKVKVRLVHNLGRAVAEAPQRAKETAEKTQEKIVRVIDKNDNGKIDIEDFGISKEKLTQVKEQLVHTIEESKLEIERKVLNPVFALDFVPNMFCIVPRDVKRKNAQVCEGAIGYLTTVKGVELLNIYDDCADALGISYYPAISNTVYYVDPFQPKLYISIQEYFSYLKKARVSELTKIAQDLGAKKVTITLKERKELLVGKKREASIKTGKGKGEISQKGQSNEFSSIHIAEETTFNGHDHPVEPKLVYFKNESDIEKLIQMRLDPNTTNAIKSKAYQIEHKESSGITERDALTIDVALSKIKAKAAGSVSKDVQRERRTVMEYYIEF